MRQLKITQQITSRETISLNKYLQDISPIPLISAAEESELAIKIKEGDMRAFNRLVEANLRFVVSVAKQYQSSGERLDDLISSGNEGLMEAAKRFDHSRGFKFISYAVWWIRQSITKFLSENSKSIRIPLNKVLITNKVRTAQSKLEQSLNRNPTPEEILEHLQEEEVRKIEYEIFDQTSTGEPVKLKFDKFTTFDIQEILNINAPISSLDMKINEDSDTDLIDLLLTDTLEDVSISIKKKDFDSTLKRIFAQKLTDREKQILILSFGLFGNSPKSLEEIGEEFELTRERVRQIREKCIRKLKLRNSINLIKEYC